MESIDRSELWSSTLCPVAVSAEFLTAELLSPATDFILKLRRYNDKTVSEVYSLQRTYHHPHLHANEREGKDGIKTIEFESDPKADSLDALYAGVDETELLIDQAGGGHPILSRCTVGDDTYTEEQRWLVSRYGNTFTEVEMRSTL
jgi:hypothetical protein